MERGQVGTGFPGEALKGPLQPFTTPLSCLLVDTQERTPRRPGPCNGPWSNALTAGCLVKPLRCWGYLLKQLARNALTNTPSALYFIYMTAISLRCDWLLIGLTRWAGSSLASETRLICAQSPALDVVYVLVQWMRENT